FPGEKSELHAALLLMFLMSSWLTVDGRKSQYQAFQRQHINEPSHLPFNDADCNTIVKSQKMTTPICKPFNTFIQCLHLSTAQNRYYSNDSFYVTNCELIRKDQQQGCVYHATTVSWRICITCEQPHQFPSAPLSQDTSVPCS
uniref:Ribonuclease A-domain domain-containing protein n=1 Tax=Crocodylus porosus TaxID=8502 RepID=A0A7M4E710_CROPO